MTPDQKAEAILPCTCHSSTAGTHYAPCAALHRPAVAEAIRSAQGRALAAINLVLGVVRWAQEAYGWEEFWADMQWRPESQVDQNGRKLRDFLREAEDLYPELKELHRP